MQNTASPFASQIFQKALTTAYYVVQLRLLTRQDFVDYIFAGVVLLYAASISDWGLGTLLTRKIAEIVHAPEQSGKSQAQRQSEERELFGRMLSLRLGLSLLTLIPFLAIGFFPPLRQQNQIGDNGVWALFFLGLTLFPTAFSASATALYNANERLALPALIQIPTALINVTLGVLAMLFNWGAAGLGLAALLTNFCTVLVFWRLMSRDFFAPTLAFDRQTARDLLAQAFPLMINGLLINIFFRFDDVIIKNMHVDSVSYDVSTYENAYKIINVTQIIAPSVVLALFPRMARSALSDHALLTRQFRGAIKALLIIGLPIVALTVVLSEWLITIITLGKDLYLPYSAWALSILIWYLPLSFINGVTQYVLISLNRQRLLTWAIAAAAAFNIGTNLVAVPALGIYGAAIVTVLSEIVLMVPFLGWTARDLGVAAIKPGVTGLRLAMAGVLLFGLTFGLNLAGINPLIAAGIGLALYLALLLLLRVISRNELQLIRSVVSRGK